MKLEDLEEIVCEACGFTSEELCYGLCPKCTEEKKREAIHNNEEPITIPDSESDISERSHTIKSSTGHIPDEGGSRA